MYASFSSNMPDLIYLLLDHKHDPVDVNAVSDENKTAIFIATENGMINIVKALLEANARVDIAEDGLGFIPLHSAVFLFGSNRDAALAIAHMLLEGGKGLQQSRKNKEGRYLSRP